MSLADRYSKDEYGNIYIYGIRVLTITRNRITVEEYIQICYIEAVRRRDKKLK